MSNKIHIPEIDLRELENKLKSSNLVINISFLANPIGNYFKHQQQKKEIDIYIYAFKNKYSLSDVDFDNLLTELKNGYSSNTGEINTNFELDKIKSFDLKKGLLYQFDKFKRLSIIGKLGLVTIMLAILYAFGFLIDRGGSIGKPSECDCREVMMHEDGSVDAAKRILGNSYGADFMEQSQRECGLKYWNDIDKWQTLKGLSGTPKDNAMEFFMEKCK